MAEKLETWQILSQAIDDATGHHGVVFPRLVLKHLEMSGFHIIAPEDPETIERAAKAMMEPNCDDERTWEEVKADPLSHRLYMESAEAALTAAVSPDQERQDNG